MSCFHNDSKREISITRKCLNKLYPEELEELKDDLDNGWTIVQDDPDYFASPMEVQNVLIHHFGVEEDE